MRKLKLLLAACALTFGGVTANAQASYNTSWTEGVEVSVGYDYFLYNIGSGNFLTGGMDWGSRASADHAGKTVEFRTVSDGVYKIWSYYYSNNTLSNDGWLGTNSYLDAGEADIANCVFTKVDVSGYTNAYTIKDNVNNKFLYYNPDDTRVNWGESADNNYAYWLIIPKASRDNIGDYTYYIPNQGINRPWERQVWCGYDWQQNNRGDWKTWDNNGWSNHPYYTVGGNDSNPCGEKYHRVFDFYQTIARSLPEGRYRLYAQAFWRDGSSGESYLYMGDAQQPLVQLNANGEGTTESMVGASTAFSAGQYVNSVEKFFSTATNENDVRIGINMTTANQWVIFDNFYLKYLGKVVKDYAVELPDGGSMAADTWYYFDIATAADDYKATATTLGDIICVNDEYSLTSATSGTINLKAEANSFNVGRYYVKSSSANNLVVEAASFQYIVGDATLSLSDGNYTQTNTFTATFENESTNDPSATFAILDADKIKVNNVKATASLSGKVLTITLAETLAASTNYSINIEAGAIGFDAANANTAISLTVKTPAVFDGHYFIKKDGSDLFFSRGGDDNKQVVLDQFGVPVKITTDASNMSRVKFIDTGLLLGASGSSNMYWTDKGDGTPSTVNWTITKSGDKYKFYLLSMEDAKKGMNIDGDAPKSDTEANACEWELELPAAHPAKLQAVKDAQAAGVATAMGIDGVTTQAQMAAKLAADYVTTSIAITGTGGENKEAWQKSASTGTGSEFAVFEEETVTGLTPGLYRLRVYAFERIAGGQTVYDAGGAAGLAYVYANDQKVKLASLFDVAADTPWKSGNDLEFGGKYYANGQDGAQAAFNAGNYANDVYVQVVDEGSGTGSIKFGIKQPNCYYSGSNAHNNAQWICYNNFSLTFFEAKPTDAQKQALADAITAAEGNTLGFETGEFAPYNNVAALAALTAAKAVDPAVSSAADVVAATTALTSATWTANTEEVNAIFDGSFSSTYSHDGNVMPIGWHGVGDKDNATNVRLMWNYESNPGLNATSSKQAAFAKFTALYGTEAGYTMPLKAGTYKLDFIYGGWNEQGTRDIKVYSGDTQATVTPLTVTAKNNQGHTTAESWSTYNGIITIPADGDYVLSFYRENTTSQNQLVFSDIVLKKTTPVYAVVGSKKGDDTDKVIFSGGWDQETTTDIMTKNGEEYTKTYTDLELDAQTIAFKVIVKNDVNAKTAAAWYPNDNQEVDIPVKGVYDITFTFKETGSVVSGVATQVKENLTVGTAGWATAKTAHNVDFTNVTTLEAYVATLTGTNVTLTKVEKVPANTPIVLKGVTSYVDIIDDAPAIAENDLTWYDEYKVNDSYAHIYALKLGADGNAKFARVADGLTFHNKAVIELIGATARDFFDIVFAGDDTTGIDSISAEKNVEGVYNMNGQRVNKAQKGLYIINGKKVVVK